MRRFSYWAAILAAWFLLAGCQEMDTSAGKLRFDRDICERCKMIISDRNHALEVVYPKERRRYYFDDVGCLALWVRDNQISWLSEALIYVTDSSNGRWIEARSAAWVEGYITPMAFGYAAFAPEKKEMLEAQGKHIYQFSEVMETIQKEKER